MASRNIPCNLEAEQSVLGAMIISKINPKIDENYFLLLKIILLYINFRKKIGRN